MGYLDRVKVLIKEESPGAETELGCVESALSAKNLIDGGTSSTDGERLTRINNLPDYPILPCRCGWPDFWLREAGQWGKAEWLCLHCHPIPKEGVKNPETLSINGKQNNFIERTVTPVTNATTNNKGSMMPHSGYFNFARDNKVLELGGFWCCACLMSHESNKQSPDSRYCQGCYDFLNKEAELLSSNKQLKWIPKRHSLETASTKQCRGLPIGNETLPNLESQESEVKVSNAEKTAKTKRNQ